MERPRKGEQVNITSGSNKGAATVIANDENCNLLLVGLDGFTLEDLAERYPSINIGIHVKDGDKWVPVNKNPDEVNT